MTEETTLPEGEQVTQSEPATEASPATAATSVFKPHGEEFKLDVDFAAVAAAVGLPIEQVEFTITESEEGNTLSGKAKA